MWRSDRDRTDDPRTDDRETQRLARDEYDRPRYGSPQSAFGERPQSRNWNAPAPSRETHLHLRDDSRPRWDARPVGAPPQYGEVPASPGDSRRHAAPGLDEVRVHEIMTRRVTSVHPATSVERAARLMEECDCGALPVVGDNGVLVGIVTDRDIALRVVARGRDARSAIVADCMTEHVFACFANESVAECMRQRARHQVRRMPIVDDRGRLAGIIAQGDLARHAGHHPVHEERRALAEVVCAVSEPSHMPYR